MKRRTFEIGRKNRLIKRVVWSRKYLDGNI